MAAGTGGTMAEPRYTHDRETHTRDAARVVVPYLVERFGPRRVLDVGCGLGTWMRVFADLGCEVRGLEGPWVPEDLLDVPRGWIRTVDLEGEVEDPGRFDLALCLEVAEHLSPRAGDGLVELLTQAADVVVFSAAVPGQGGDHHVNERWPAYWQERFARHGFSFEDALRERFWNEEEVEWWYRQNLFLCRKGGPAASRPARALVHPGLLAKKRRIEEDFYRGRVPVRTGLLVFVRSLLRLFRTGS